MMFFKSSNKDDNGLLRNIGIYILLNAAILLVFALAIRIYYVDNTKNLVAEKYYNILVSNFNSVEKDIHGIVNSVPHLKDSAFDSCMSYGNSAEPQASDISETISSFQNFIDNYDIVDSVLILNSNLKTVISNEGKYELDKFLNENYIYSDYPLYYWKSYKAPLYHIRMLPPSKVKTLEAEKTIIPIVFSSVKDTVSSSLLVVNISVDKIFNQTNITKNLTKNSRFYIVSNYDKTVFRPQKSPPPDNDFVEYLKNNEVKDDSFSVYKDKKYGKQLLIRYAPTSHILSYEYIILMPSDDISDIRSVKWISNFIIFIIAALIAGWVLMGKAKIIKPVGEIESSAKQYKHEADTMIPIVREKYVSDIINSPLAYIDGSVSDVLAKSRFAFKHNNFIAVIVRYIISKQQASEIRQGNTISELNLKLKIIFNKNYESVNICLNDESLYIVSLETPDEKENIAEIVNDFIKLHKTETLTLAKGIGEVYSGHINIKKCVETANYDLIKCITPDEVKKNTKQAGTNNKYIYKKQDDDKLFNMLVAGYLDETMHHISEIVRVNIENGISEAAIKELYRQILATLARVMDMKNIEYKHSDEQSSIDFIVDILKKEPDEIYKYIMNCINTVSAKTKKYNTKLDFSKIIRYIEDHYTEDLYLDIIALHFGTSSKYLSRKLKEHLGMNFHSFLTRIRVNHAKILITSTDMKIEEIGQSVGYMSNTTFVRAFKSETGISPAAYKKQSKQ